MSELGEGQSQNDHSHNERSRQNGDTQEFQIISDSSAKQSVMERTSTRRSLLGNAARLIAGGTAAAVVGKYYTDKRENPKQEGPLIERVPTVVEKLNGILSQKLFSHERIEAENAYAESVTALQEIDAGLSVCADIGARVRLLEKRAELRAQGHIFMVQLNESQREFCREHGIDEEILAMCLDAREQAKAIIAKLQPEIREDELGKSVDPAMLMMNAGGVAQLIMQETSGFREIGGATAMSQLTDPKDQVALKEYCRLISEETGLNYNPENVPGSERGDKTENWSGGAIGIQFMPQNAMEYHNLFKSVGEQANIFDPLTSIKMAWVFIARHEWVGPEKDDFRWGYMKGDPEAIRKAIRKWNDLEREVQAIETSAYDGANLGVENTD